MSGIHIAHYYVNDDDDGNDVGDNGDDDDIVLLKLICHSLQEGLDRPAGSLDRWLSHQLSSQLT